MPAQPLTLALTPNQAYRALQAIADAEEQAARAELQHRATFGSGIITADTAEERAYMDMARSDRREAALVLAAITGPENARHSQERIAGAYALALKEHEAEQARRAIPPAAYLLVREADGETKSESVHLTNEDAQKALRAAVKEELSGFPEGLADLPANVGTKRLLQRLADGYEVYYTVKALKA